MKNCKKYVGWCMSLFERLVGRGKSDEYVSMTLKVSNMRVCGKSIAELEALLNRHCKIVGILQKDDKVIRMAASEKIINAGDQLLVQIDQHDVKAMQALVGESI